MTDFVNGMLTPEQQQVVERHVERCGQCVIQLENVGGDTLGNRIKALATHFDEAVDSGQQSDQDDAIPEELQSLDRYEIIERIGVGGMGEVFRARQRVMDRPVAIKVLRRHLFENDRAVARFHNEVKVAAQLNHPNIVHSYDAEVSRGLNLLVMELVDGTQLSDWISQDQTLSPLQASQITIEIAKGLRYAHEQGMIHRDIKPQNVMVLANQSVKITDFGLGKFVRDSAQGRDKSLTFEGETFGTPDYIAPEQIRDSAAADFRSDIYSLGCTLYFMLAGRPPFADMSVGEKLAGHLEKQPVALKTLRPGLPDSLVDVVDRMMHKDASQRFSDYSELIDRLSPMAESDLLDGGTRAQPLALSADRSETAVDLVPAVSPVIRATRRPSRARRRTILYSGIGVVTAGLLGLALYGVAFSNLFTGSAPDDGKVHLAVVLPAEKAYHREVVELQKSCLHYPNVELHYIAEKVGDVTFDPTKSRALKLQVSAERTLLDVSPRDFDAVIFFGGWDGSSGITNRYAYEPALNLQAKKFIQGMLDQEKPVASVCGGTAVLAFAGILDGKRAASCKYIRDAMNASTAKWTPVENNLDKCTVVRDGLLVTGGNAVNVREIVQQLMTIVSQN